MSDSFFFYDLETSGLNPATQRIMQFGGQRTDMDLNPVGDPIDILVKLTDDIVPEPEAIVVHGITPQRTLEEGYSELQFIAKLQREVFTPGTTIVGFNNISFDDEFIRNSLYRNLQDPYRWQWQDRRSRWDLLKILVMARALRPEGINWSFDKNGKPTNRLEILSKANSVKHDNAHDALGDVNATIDMARLLKSSQPKLFDWLLKVRSKAEVARLVNLDDPAPFVYSSGRLSSDYLKTSIFFPIAPDPSNPNAVLCFDLRFVVDEFSAMTPEEMVKHIYVKREDRDKITSLPVASVALNRCPAVAPLGVLDDEAQARIGLSVAEAQKNLTLLNKSKHFGDLVRSAYELRQPRAASKDVDQMIYDGFIGDSDRALLQDTVRLDAEGLADYHPKFSDERLDELLFRYKARHFISSLDETESKSWHEHKMKLLSKGTRGAPSLESYMTRLSALKQRGVPKFLIEQLRLYGELLVPEDIS